MKKNKVLLIVLVSLLIITSLGSLYEYITITKILASNDEISETISKETIEQARKSVVTIVSGIDKDNGLRTADMVVGTGLVYNKEKCYIVTNYHVVKDANFYIIAADNLSYEAKLVGFDEKMDIAIIAAENANLREAKFGDSKKCNVGDKVFTIGTPLSPSLKNTFLDGVISGIDRTGLSEYKLIQSNIASNPGLSGSPLINTNGEVIGINSFQSTEFGSQSLTFACPSEDVIFALDELEKNNKITLPYIGVDVKENAYPNYGISSISGVIVDTIYPASPAEQAKLMVNDRIVAINGFKIDNKTDYNEFLRTLNADKYLEFSIVRNDENVKIKIKINEKK